MQSVKRSIILLIMGFFSSFFGCSRPPSAPVGYDWMLERNGGKQFQYERSDQEMEKETYLGGQWAKSWQSSLTFFTAELSSTDPRRIKTSMVCLTDLAMGMDMTLLSETSPVTASDRSQFAKDFPVAKLKQILAEHPDYDPWISAIRFTSFVEHFPEAEEPEVPSVK